MAMARMRLVIGDKRWSSWSLRPWIAMKRLAIPFDEINIALRAPDKVAQILKHSPSGKVPALLVGDQVIWDSLAILEYLAEERAGLWPKDKMARAHARCISAEMHSGFQALRQHCPMEFISRTPKSDLPDDVKADIRRIVAIWREARGRHGKSGAFLYGDFSGADAMYAPVVSRFVTYVPDLKPHGDDGTAAAYVKAMMATPEMQAWDAGAQAEEKGA